MARPEEEERRGEEEESEDEEKYTALGSPVMRSIAAGMRPPLQQLQHLRHLTLHAVGLTSTDGLSDAPICLEHLNLSGNLLQQADDLPLVPSLRSVDISANRLRAAPPLSGLSHLRSLFLGMLDSAHYCFGFPPFWYFCLLHWRSKTGTGLSFLFCYSLCTSCH